VGANIGQRLSGTVKRLFVDKGYGWLKADDGSEYFVHHTACQGFRLDALREGDAVAFEVGEGPKGPRAESVERA
jgi:CspA family cold shock protein